MNRRGIHSCRIADTFSYFSCSTETAHKIEIPLKTKPLPDFTKDPITLGDHLRRRRLELGLYQKDGAVQIGVTTSSVWSWEHGWMVDVRCIPHVIEFLGYNPIEQPVDVIKKLVWHK